MSWWQWAGLVAYPIVVGVFCFAGAWAGVAHATITNDDGGE